MELSDHASSIEFLVSDRDMKFTASFDAVVAADGTRSSPPVRAPRVNATCERVVGTFRRECPDRMLTLGRHRLDAVRAECVEDHNTHRPRRSLSQRPHADSDGTPLSVGHVDAARLRRADRPSGPVQECRMVA